MTEFINKIKDAKEKSELYKSIESISKTEKLKTKLIEFCDALIDEDLTANQRFSIARLRGYLITTFKNFD